MRPFGYFRDLAFASTADQRRTQEGLLQEHVAWCREHSPYYAGLLARHRAVNMSVGSLVELPPTSKAVLEQNNDDFLAVSHEKIVDIVLSSGTTGKPTRIMYTERDLDRLAYNEEISFSACGLTRHDVVLLTCTMDRCFVAGLAYFLGIRRLGAAAIRNGHGSMESHLAVMRQMKPTALVGVPSFLRKLGDFIHEQGMDPRSFGVQRLVCIGEPLRDRYLDLLKLGTDLESLWGAKVFSTYASSEIVTSFCECTSQCGGHLHPDLAVVEILGPDDRRLPPGEPGEVVVTPLGVEGMPLIRFRTGDISFLVTDPCDCGRKSPRLGPILGRRSHMLKVRGTTVYPLALHSALDDIPGVSEYYIVATSADELSDEVSVHVSVKGEGCTVDRVREQLQARVRVTPAVVIEPDDAVRAKVYSPKSRKPVRFFDARKTSC